MRQSLWFVLVILLLATMGAPAAEADITYVVSFSGNDAPTIVGSDLITYSTSLDQFTGSLEISFLGTEYDLAATDYQITTTPTTDGYQWEANGGLEEIGILDTTYEQFIYGIGIPKTATLYSGTATLTPTPEPGTAILWLTGIVLMILLTRKRLAQLLRLDTETQRSLSAH